MCPIVVVQMGLIRYLQQRSMDPCGKTHMGCMWDPFGLLWATHKGYMVLGARKPVFGGGSCEQQRCRPACASALSDQHLCCSLFVCIIAKLTTGEISNF